MSLDRVSDVANPRSHRCRTDSVIRPRRALASNHHDTEALKMGDERIEHQLLNELTVQSQDLNSDAVRITRDALDEFTDQQQEVTARRRWSPLAMVAGLVGAGTVLGAGTASAADSTDIMALQTAASLENLAISVY